MRRRSNRFRLLPATVCGGYRPITFTLSPMPSTHHDIFNDPLFGDGADPAPEPPPPPVKAAWPREDLDFSQHTGSAEFFRYSPLFPQLVLSEGARDVGERCGAYWFFDIIGSYQPRLTARQKEFQVWKLEVTHGPPPPKPWFGPDNVLLDECTNSWALVTCNNGNREDVVQQLVAYTDFPLKELTLFVSPNGEGYTIYLPSER